MGRTNDIMVTNDGATILKSLYVDNPAAKVLVGMPPSSVHLMLCEHLPCAVYYHSTVCRDIPSHRSPTMASTRSFMATFKPASTDLTVHTVISSFVSLICNEGAGKHVSDCKVIKA